MKLRKAYVNHSKRKSKTYLIHGLRHSSDECKVLGDFVYNFDKSKHTKDHENHPILKKKYRPIDNNAIINNVVDDILLNETKKVSSLREALEFWDPDCDEKNQKPG